MASARSRPLPAPILPPQWPPPRMRLGFRCPRCPSPGFSAAFASVASNPGEGTEGTLARRNEATGGYIGTCPCYPIARRETVAPNKPVSTVHALETLRRRTNPFRPSQRRGTAAPNKPVSAGNASLSSCPCLAWNPPAASDGAIRERGRPRPLFLASFLRAGTPALHRGDKRSHFGSGNLTIFRRRCAGPHV
jgi:hypothetical protein